jgi:hypothetical protein
MTVNVLSLLWACVLGVGPVILIAVLQNHRDHRARRLFHEVANHLSAEALRSDVVVNVRVPLLWRGATVRLDLGPASPAEVWETAARLRQALPAWVRLEVDGRVEGPLAVRRPVRITVESPETETLRRAA